MNSLLGVFFTTLVGLVAFFIKQAKEQSNLAFRVGLLEQASKDNKGDFKDLTSALRSVENIATKIESLIEGQNRRLELVEDRVFGFTPPVDTHPQRVL
jgi:hypothetical protein